jgi:hypothetical protein
MNTETKAAVKRLAITVIASLFLSYFLVVVFLMFGPLHVGGQLAITQSGKFTAVLALVVCVPVYLYFARRDSKRKTAGH